MPDPSRAEISAITPGSGAGDHDSDHDVDVILIGAGIMSATLGTLIAALEPTWRIAIVERLDTVAAESSNPWNNAGTGHAALCELNYTPELPDGSIDITKAVAINEQFQISRELWASLIREGILSDAGSFLSVTPHMTFVKGAANVDYLRRRWETLRAHPRFAEMEFSDSPATIARWAPLLMSGRIGDEPVAATRVAAGTDVNFGALTEQMIAGLASRGAQVLLEREVVGLKQAKNGSWSVKVKDRRWNATRRAATVRARFVFVGAGGYALPLLQKSGIPEIRGYGGFPISGQFLRTTNPEIVTAHHAKVYGKASVGSPPMSVPHLDTRVVDGESSLLFGPYAGFSSRYLKTGSLLDLFASLRPGNIVPMLSAGLRNIPLTKYLIGQLVARPETKFTALQEFYPGAVPGDWESITAGQRVQVIKPDPAQGGVLQFGTELIMSQDGSIAGLLGASPGASTAAPIMVDLLRKAFPHEAGRWEPRLAELIPLTADRG